MNRTSSLSQSQPVKSEFQSIFTTGNQNKNKLSTTATTTTTVTSPTATATSTTNTNHQEQLLATVSNDLDELDSVRLELQLLIKQFQSKPYSSRLIGQLLTVRNTALKQAELVHQHFKLLSVGGDSTTTINNLELIEWDRLYRQFASINSLLSDICIQINQLSQQQKSIKERSRSRSGSRSRSNSPASIDTAIHTNSSSKNPALIKKSNNININNTNTNRTAAATTTVNYQNHSDNDTITIDSTSPDNNGEYYPQLLVTGPSNRNRTMEVMELNSMVVDVASMFADLHSIVKQQQEHLNLVESKVQSAHSSAIKAESELIQASKYTTVGLSLLGGIVGGLMLGFPGAIVGAKTVVGMAAGAAGLGTAGVVAGVKAGSIIAKGRSHSNPNSPRNINKSNTTTANSNSNQSSPIISTNPTASISSGSSFSRLFKWPYSTDTK